MEIKGMTFNQNLKFISWTVILFSLPIILFISLLIISYQKAGYFQWGETASMSAVFFIIISIITVPGLLLHYRYYKQDKGKSLKFRPTYFEITQYGQTNKIYFKDISRIEKHYPVWSHRNPWSDYGYIKVVLKDNLIFSYSCLTHDIISSAILFKNKEVTVEDCRELYPL